MRLPRGVRYGPVRTASRFIPTIAAAAGSGAADGAPSKSGVLPIRPPWSPTSGPFAWARAEHRCKGTVVDLSRGVRVCEAFRTIESPAG
jgi:hypothetical protein